jgi:Spy/CpxP family protein refolding chaperone
MRKTLSIVIALAAAAAWSQEKTPPVASASPAAVASDAPAPSPEEVVQNFRTDLQASSADTMAKGLTLTADQAATFWPLFEEYQKEQSEIIDSLLAAMQKYAENYETVSDADSLEYINAVLSSDRKMYELRTRWLGKFQKVLPVKVAARAIQIDRRLSQVTQVAVSQRFPLIR